MLLILREEIICMVILLFLIFYYAVNKVKDKEMLFLKIAGFGLLHVIFDIITVITVNHQEVIPAGINRLAHICFYLAGILFAVAFYHYVIQLTLLYDKMQLLKIAGYVPLGLFGLLLLFLPMEYVQGQGTVYSYGPLAMVGYGLFLLYCTVCVALLVISRKTLDQRVKRALLPMIGVMYVAVILQALIPELLMTGANVTFVCLGIFVALDNPDKDFVRQALWDFSSGLKNRNSYNRDMEKYRQQMKKRKAARIGFLMADMNYLKTVNDHYGHMEGDRLIASAAAVLKKQLSSAEGVYRMGGDEFTAVFLMPDDRRVLTEIEKVRSACKQDTSHAVPLSMAMGYASGGLEETEKILKTADERMYADKEEIKKHSAIPMR